MKLKSIFKKTPVIKPEVKETVLAAAKVLAEAGAEVEEYDLSVVAY